MTKSDRDHLSAVARLGCIVCRNQFGVFSEAEIHHIRDGQGMAQRSPPVDRRSGRVYRRAGDAGGKDLLVAHSYRAESGICADGGVDGVRDLSSIEG